MGIHHLVTGLNGAGKTLYAVAEILRKIPGKTVEYKGKTYNRRIVQGGIRALLIEHELMEVPEIDVETYRDEFYMCTREPGTGPVEWIRPGQDGRLVSCGPDDPGAERIVQSMLNWWLWCQPGDLIVPDECQRVFRPMASGKRVPMYISKLETARHYGVEFLYITQHPQLLNSNVRKLVGPHEDVRRIFGSNRTMIYQWDKVSDPDRISKATGRTWKHPPDAYRLYKSAELHQKFGQRIPIAVFAVIFGLVALVGMGWFLMTRLQERFSPPKPAAAAPAGKTGAAGAAMPAPGATGAAGAAAPQGKGAWPVYQPEKVPARLEPYAGRGLQWEGGYQAGRTLHAVFGVVIDGQRVASVSLAQLVRMGYLWTELGPCAGVLEFEDFRRLITCAMPAALVAEVKPAVPVPSP